MGWTVLYIAFGLVALWLLGEVLLQYKARLRWRLLAFAGFVGVVLGVLIPSVYVIGAGAIAFAIGQTYVTLSFRRGFSTGWAIGGNPGESRRRKGVPESDPTLEVSDLEYEAEYRQDGPGAGYDDRDQGYGDRDQAYGSGDQAYGSSDGYAPQQASVYAPEPLPDDTGSYGIYDTSAQGYPQQPAAAAAAADSSSYGYDAYNNGYDQQNYGYDQQGQQSYAAYSDPYIGGAGTYDTGQYDTYGSGQQGYDSGQYDQYQQGGYGDSTPPGGVWVPQQRNGDETLSGGLPPEQPGYPPYNPEGYDTGYNEQQQYRY
ncbi:hypothetical protein H9Y04_06610 [Streptomyces sp. TRM66268-LWL]|uniref:Uncharacterized protein n=1 Tax=Streptomyces polyasparticus TaxID=2767826 RepID=A0ABR7SD07_9ACTN|nr:hypothetical protein [Streptomyces polyasparticus]MBC9712243.1 hypothetical protein [Streptomyces polyasparticus]